MSSVIPAAQLASAESACRLDGAGRIERLAWIEREILPHVVRAEARSQGFVWELEGEASLRERLENWVELERACCEDLRFALETAASGAARLEVSGSDPAVALLASLVPAEPAPAASGGWRSVASAGGYGLAGAFGLLCGLPLAVAALFGAAAAAPLAGLETPTSLAGLSLLFAALIGVWQWRRRVTATSAASAARRDSSPCGC